MLSITADGKYHYQDTSNGYLTVDMEVQRFFSKDVIVSNFYTSSYSDSASMALCRIKVSTATKKMNEVKIFDIDSSLKGTIKDLYLQYSHKVNCIVRKFY